MIDYEGEQYQYPIIEDYSPSNQIMPHTCWGELGSRSLISNSYSAVFVSYNCSGFIVGRFDCSICTVPMRDPGLDRCSPSLLPPHPPTLVAWLLVGHRLIILLQKQNITETPWREEYINPLPSLHCFKRVLSIPIFCHNQGAIICRQMFVVMVKTNGNQKRFCVALPAQGCPWLSQRIQIATRKQLNI